jgi:hypothetical protein
MVNKYDTIVIDPEHSIEFGKAPWDSSVDTIRRRKNNPGGGYDPFSSSEIPINEGFLDIGRLVCECLKKDLINRSDMSEILKEIIESARRQGHTVSIV